MLPFEIEEEHRDRDCCVTIKQENSSKILTVSQVLTFICTIVEMRKLKNVMRLYDSKNQQDIIFEMKFFEYNIKSRFVAEAFQDGKIQINGVTLRKLGNREVIQQVQKVFTSVVVYEVPDEIEDEEIMVVLRKYGNIRGEMHRHLHKGYSVENGNRSVLFSDPPDNIPTILWVGGNRIKCRYDGQDRTPICSYCKTKGHYRGICEKEKLDIEFKRRMQDEEEMEEVRRAQEKQEEEEAKLQKQAEMAWAKLQDEKERLRKEKEAKEKLSAIFEAKAKARQEERERERQEAEEEEIEANEKRREENKSDSEGEGSGSEMDDNVDTDGDDGDDDMNSDSSFQCGQPQVTKRSYSNMAGEVVDEVDKKKKDSKSQEERERKRIKDKEEKQRKEREELDQATYKQLGMRQQGAKQKTMKLQELKQLQEPSENTNETNGKLQVTPQETSQTQEAASEK